MRRPVTTSLLIGGLALATLAGVLASCDHEDGIIDGTIVDGGSSSGSSGGGSATRTDSPRDGEVFTTRLVSYSDCNGLLNAIRTAATERVGPYGLEAPNYWGRPEILVDGPIPERAEAQADVAESAPAPSARESVAAAESAPSAPAAIQSADVPPPPAAAASSDDAIAGASTPQRDVDFSGTNVQVEGVDEADIVKTDGQRIIISSGEWVTIVDVTGDEPRVSGRVHVPNNNASEMLFYQDRVLLLSNSWGNIRPLTTTTRDSETASSPPIRQREAALVNMTEVLLDDTPRRGNTLQIEGNYLSSRSIGGTAHVVFNHYAEQEFGFVYPQNSNNQASIAIATEANRRVVQASTLADWTPQFRLIAADGSLMSEGQLLNCSRVNTPNKFNTFSMLGVLTLDLTSSLDKGTSAATFAGGQIVYASQSNLYVVTDTVVPQVFFEDEASRADLEDRYRTSVHKFSLSDAGAEYQASGSVKGHLLNQFSMNEFRNHLFVATTNGTPWGGNSESFIHSLRQDDESLTNIGSVGNMGRGERIYSVRFIGERAYVVTFRQVDPLYVVDLADPARMKVLGELKIPGYSAYLHPLGDNLLAGVGADATEQGRVTGAKVSLFDVSDPTKPVEIDNYVLADAQSSVEWDHRAFLWWQPQKALVVPVTSWNRADRNGALVLILDRDTGINLRGLIQHDSSKDNYYNRIYQIIRSLVISDNLWTLSQAVLQSNDLVSLEQNARITLPN